MGINLTVGSTSKNCLFPLREGNIVSYPGNQKKIFFSQNFDNLLSLREV